MSYTTARGRIAAASLATLITATSTLTAYADESAIDAETLPTASISVQATTETAPSTSSDTDVVYETQTTQSVASTPVQPSNSATPANNTASNTASASSTASATTPTPKPQVVKPGTYLSEDGQPIPLPQATENPFNVAVGDNLESSNFHYAGKNLICKPTIICSLRATIPSTVTSVQDTKNGTIVRVDNFIGYKGHPVYKNGQLIGVVDGSNNGLSRIILFGTKQAADEAAPQYKKLGSTGALNVLRTQSGSSAKAESFFSQVFNPKFAGSVDQQETDYREDAWVKEDGKYFTKISYDPTNRAFTIDPKAQYTAKTIFPGLLGLFGSTSIPGGGEAMWKEAVAMGVPDTTSIKQQFICHAQGSALKKSGWTLELGRPATKTQAGQAWTMCNPRYARKF